MCSTLYDKAEVGASSIFSCQRAQWSYVRVGGRLVRVDALAMDDDEGLDPRFRSGRMHSRTTTALSPLRFGTRERVLWRRRELPIYPAPSLVIYRGSAG